MNLDRILFIGSPGSGKSTLAKIVAEKKNLPLVHLDRLFWRDGWTQVSKEDFDRSLAEELKKERWIIDGNFSRTMEMRIARADTIVFLDYPRHICVFRVLKRVITNYGESRSDMGGNCPERFDLSFLKFVWKFPEHSKKKILSLLENAEGKNVITVRNEKERKAFLALLEAKK